MAADGDGACSRALQSGKQMQKSRLAAPGPPPHKDKLTLRNNEIDAVDGPDYIRPDAVVHGQLSRIDRHTR